MWMIELDFLLKNVALNSLSSGSLVFPTPASDFLTEIETVLLASVTTGPSHTNPLGFYLIYIFQRTGGDEPIQ